MQSFSGLRLSTFVCAVLAQTLHAQSGATFGNLISLGGTPSDIVAKLHAQATRAIQAPDIRDRMSAEGAEFVGDTPEQFTAFLKSELTKWGRAVKASTGI